MCSRYPARINGSTVFLFKKCVVFCLSVNVLFLCLFVSWHSCKTLTIINGSFGGCMSVVKSRPTEFMYSSTNLS